MKVYTEIVYHMTPNGLELVSEKSFDYEGPVAKLDRAAQAMAKKSYDQALSVSDQEHANSQQDRNALMPGLELEANNPVGYNPQQENDQLVAGEQSAGGAIAGITGQADLQGARTGNSAGYSSSLDSAMRDKGRLLSQEALGVKNRSAELGQEKQMRAQGELGKIYGQDTDAMLHSMGLENDATNTEIAAGKSGWFQNMTDMVNAAGNAAGGAGKLVHG